MSEELHYVPFPNGTSYACWLNDNCDRCWKGPSRNQVGRNNKCALETAIATSCATGNVRDTFQRNKEANAKRIADRLNWNPATYIENDCPEREEKRPPSKSRTNSEVSDTPTLL